MQALLDSDATFREDFALTEALPAFVTAFNTTLATLAMCRDPPLRRLHRAPPINHVRSLCLDCLQVPSTSAGMTVSLWVVMMMVMMMMMI
jgi:hypothetical protein